MAQFVLNETAQIVICSLTPSSTSPRSRMERRMGVTQGKHHRLRQEQSSGKQQINKKIKSNNNNITNGGNQCSLTVALPYIPGSKRPVITFLEDDMRWYRITSGSQSCLLLATAKINPLPVSSLAQLEPAQLVKYFQEAALECTVKMYINRGLGSKSSYFINL